MYDSPSHSTSGPLYRLSPWSKRAGGALVDSLLYVVASVAAMYVGSIFNDATGALLGIATGLGVALWQLIEQGNTGQTIGKRVIAIRLVKEGDAEPVGPLMSVGRAFVHIIDSAFCYVGWLFPLWDSKRQTLADKVLDTVVIEVPKP